MGANMGTLPPAYNKAVHGPYDPAIFYGKKVQFSSATIKNALL